MLNSFYLSLHFYSKLLHLFKILARGNTNPILKNIIYDFWDNKDYRAWGAEEGKRLNHHA